MTDKGSFNMKIWGKAFQTRKWWGRKKKWVVNYSKSTLEKKIVRKHPLSIKIYPKAHPSLIEYLNEVVQGNNDANTVNCPFQVALPLLHEGSHLLSELPPFLKLSVEVNLQQFNFHF